MELLTSLGVVDKYRTPLAQAYTFKDMDTVVGRKFYTAAVALTTLLSDLYSEADRERGPGSGAVARALDYLRIIGGVRPPAPRWDVARG